MTDRYEAQSSDLNFEKPDRAILEAIEKYTNGDLFIDGERAEALLKAGTPTWERFTAWLEEENIQPRPAPPPLTPEQKDRLLIEVVMGVPEKDSKVPFTSESRKMRRNLRAEVREMRKNGFMPDIVKD